MKLLLIILLSLIIDFETTYAKNYLWPPLFVVDTGGALRNIYTSPFPFNKNYKKALVELTHETKKRDATVIIFVEDSFSMEDVTSRDERGTPYVYLHKALLNDQARFLTAVEDGFKVLTEVFPREGENEFAMESQATTLHLFNRNYKSYYVFFKDIKNTTRVELLRQHDLIMRDVCFVVRQLLPSKVIVYYTGMKNPILSTKLRYPGPRYPVFVHPYKFRDEKQWTYLKFGGMYFILRDGRTREISNVVPTSVLNTKNLDKNKLLVGIIISNFNFTFRFTFDDHEWKLDGLRQIGDGAIDKINITDVGAPWNRSFICSTKPIILKNRNMSGYYAFVIQQFQIQISTTNFTTFGTPIFCETNILKFKKDDEEEQSESEMEDEGREDSIDDEVKGETGEELERTIYFTPSINSCLFVSVILLVTLFYSISMMMELSTFDKWASPTDKPLTIIEH